MRKLVTAEIMGKLDELAQNHYNVSSLDMMDNAGKKVAEIIESIVEDIKGKKVAIIAGPGNNGGDGFVAAKYLTEAGADVKVWSLVAKTKLKGDAKKVVTGVSKVVKDMKFTAKYIPDFFEGADIIVDAIFGTGFNANPEGLYFDVIKDMNESGVKIYSIDIPSGIHGTTGNSEDIAINADYTITLGYPKIGLYINEGYTHTGKVCIADIGLPAEIDEEILDSRVLMEFEDTKGLMKKRSLTADKKDFGKVFNFAGSLAMPGAAVLSSVAALRTGTGLLKLGIPMNISASISTVHPEIMTIPLAYAQPGYTSINAEKEVLKGFKWCDACLCGPGLSVHPETKKVARKLFQKFNDKPVVIDADALNILSENPDLLDKLDGEIVMTPHNSEMARLIGTSKELLLLDRIENASAKAMEWKCHIVLKGTPTIVALPDGRVHIHVSKNPGMAVGGMGDLLSGILAGLLGQKIKTVDAIHLALNIHSEAAEMALEECGEASMLPSDVMKYIPAAMKKIAAL